MVLRVVAIELPKIHGTCNIILYGNDGKPDLLPNVQTGH